MQSQQNKNYQRPPRADRLGQTTIGENRDIRAEKMPNGVYKLVEVTFIQTDVPRGPMYNDVLQLSKTGLESLYNLLGLVLDGLEGSGQLPVELSQYDTRFQEGG